MQIKLKKIKMQEMDKSEMAMPSMMMPMFHTDDKMMPEIEDWEVGKKYKMLVEVEMKSKSEDEMTVHGGLEIVAYKVLADKSIAEMSDKEFSSYQSQMLSER